VFFTVKCSGALNKEVPRSQNLSNTNDFLLTLTLHFSICNYTTRKAHHSFLKTQLEIDNKSQWRSEPLGYIESDRWFICTIKF
jgi:hypothetical protein